jgi:hypothetical protein
MLAIRRAFGEVARRNRLNLDGEHGHGGERYIARTSFFM